MFGYSADEVIGKPIGTLLASPFGDEFAAGLKRHPETAEDPLPAPGRVIVGKRRDGVRWGFSASSELGSTRPQAARDFQQLSPLHVRENSVGHLEMAVSLASSHFQHVGWK